MTVSRCSSIIMAALFAVVSGQGCMQTVTDMTRSASAKYKSVAAKTYVTQADLFLLDDRSQKRFYLVKRDAQYFPYDPAEFTGKEIRVAWGGKSYITDVIWKGTSLTVERIEYVAGFEMAYDRIYGRILTGKQAGKIVQMESLFTREDGTGSPIAPIGQYLKAVD